MIYNHVARAVAKEIVQQRIDALKIGQKMQDLPENLWHKSFLYYVKEDKTRKGGPNMRMLRLDPSKPSLTVTGFIFNKFVHPYENRFITVREAARLQGFPDDIKITGTLTSTQRQIGNAVPVPMAKAIFNSILRHADSIGYPNKTLNGFSMFCGAGGLDIGASQALYKGYRLKTLLAIDNWDDACNTLRGYMGDKTNVVLQDVSTVDEPLQFWKENTRSGNPPDIIFGGPPCQAFSQAGKQKGLEDERGKLVYDFIRYIEAVRPSFFVMENVSNIVSIYKGELYRDIIARMEECGYNISFGVLNSAEYGAPQLRKRAIFIGTKSEYGQVALPLPTHAESDLFGRPHYMTVGEAFDGLPQLDRESK